MPSISYPEQPNPNRTKPNSLCTKPSYKPQKNPPSPILTKIRISSLNKRCPCLQQQDKARAKQHNTPQYTVPLPIYKPEQSIY
jgi:hypothetical protein